MREGHLFPESLRKRDLRLKDLMDDYVEAVKASRAKTAPEVERRLTEVLAILGNVPPKTVKADDLERLKLKLAKGTRVATRTPASVNTIKTLEKLDRSPFLGVDLLTENNKRVRELTPDEEARFFQHVPADPVLPPYFRFLLETGARAGEACGLAWARILWADGLAQLPETKAGKEQYLVLSHGALMILRDLPRNRPHVFCWPDGRPLTIHQATKAFLRAARAAGIANLRQHDLRRTFATRRLRGGANLKAVSELLRHSTTRMTERYAHVTRADLRAAVEAGQPGPTGTPTGTEVEALLQHVDYQGRE